ncbi:MAG: SAM-dependent methyltransferase [Acidimicrobiales bacterium]
MGAGPGDTLMLTRRAARVLEKADVVVLDRHSLDAVAALAPAAAERCYVGRTAEGPAWSTERIVDLLAERAAAGLIVVRLKGGDPFVCSRGGEEHLALAERGVSCTVVPGVSAATAAPLAASVRRGRSVTIMAGNVDPAHLKLDLATLADPVASLVVLTGRSRQGFIASELIGGGLSPATPAVLVHAATRSGERVIETSLAGLADRRLPPPATIVIGPQVAEGSRRAHP